MNFIDSYQFEFIVNGIDTEMSPLNYSFNMRDSIHNFYSELTFQINDATGLIQETLTTTEGLVLDLTYGLENTNTMINNSYVIIDDSNSESAKNDSIGGKVVINAFNQFYALQEVKSDIYLGRISDIIQYTLITSGRFNNKTFNDTGNSQTWLRPLMNEKDFIQKILLPNAYSNNSRETPFFCFIDNNDEFNFRNYYSMTSSSIVKANLTYQYITNLAITPNIILDFKRIKVGSVLTKPYWNRNLYSRDRDTGLFNKTTDSIADYPQSTAEQLLIMNNSLTSGIKDLYYDITNDTAGVQESYKGRKISSAVDGMFLERFIITTMLNLSLKAGDLINIEFPLKNTDNDKKIASNYSGNYLIENSSHAWDGEKKKAQSTFIVSRKFFNVANDNLLKPNLMTGGV